MKEARFKRMERLLLHLFILFGIIFVACAFFFLGLVSKDPLQIFFLCVGALLMALFVFMVPFLAIYDIIITISKKKIKKEVNQF